MAWGSSLLTLAPRYKGKLTSHFYFTPLSLSYLLFPLPPSLPPSFLPSLLHSHYHEILQSFFAVAQSRKNPRILDNICAAISRMIMAHMQGVPLEQVQNRALHTSHGLQWLWVAFIGLSIY